MSRTARRLLIAAAVLAALVIAVVIGFRIAVDTLKTRIEQALGPESEVKMLVIGWTAIELHGIRIRAPKGWPAEDALRAERVTITPDFAGLFSARVHVPRIVVEQPYLSVHRTANGRMRLLPSLLERNATPAGGAGPAVPVTIGEVVLQDGVLEFFDASVRRPAHRTRLERLQAKVQDIAVPALDGRTTLQLDGVIKGTRRDGTLAVSGWAELAARNSDIRTKLAGVDLVALQPYLIKTNEAGVRRGTLDLSLHSKVRNNMLHAPGKAAIADLELSAGGGTFSTFMGIPRQAVIGAMKNRDGRITVDFTLEGNLDDPKFSLNENFALRMGAGVAQGLGISLEGLAKGVGGAAEGIGSAFKKLFGQ
ncbi:MAG TPA: DUF748 domain-containing protein [Noviherbaspirillum sp.]|nr:DUF748 domain-containing protein [Noviherbaspirillum sp.]